MIINTYHILLAAVPFFVYDLFTFLAFFLSER